MAIKAILFDLDGTLLPMDQDLFIKIYLKNLAKWMAPKGYAPEKMIKAVWQGSDAMVKNDGSQTNETAFWDTFTSVYGKESKNDLPKFEAFYQNTFPTVKSVCGFDPMANEVIKDAKARGYRVVLATNPMFPDMATDERIRWAGLDRSDFELVTTYENCTTSKPNPAYYLDVAKRVGADPKDCLMVGNDVGEDMIPAESVGMQVFLLTKYMINKDSIDVSRYPRGNFVDLLSFIL